MENTIVNDVQKYSGYLQKAFTKLIKLIDIIDIT